MDAVKEQIAKELETMRAALVNSKKGAVQDPEDSEWETMIQIYRECVVALERIEAVSNAQ